MRKIFISTHNDDETLFGAFTIMRHREDIEVVVVYDSYAQPMLGHASCDKATRRRETSSALYVMEVRNAPHFLGMTDLHTNGNDVACLLRQYIGCQVWYPAFEDGGTCHRNVVAEAAHHVFTSANKTEYLTCSERGKSTSGRFVEPAAWTDIPTKMIALSCYLTQIALPGYRHHFLRSQEEYYA